MARQGGQSQVLFVQKRHVCFIGQLALVVQSSCLFGCSTRVNYHNYQYEIMFVCPVAHALTLEAKRSYRRDAGLFHLALAVGGTGRQ